MQIERMSRSAPLVLATILLAFATTTFSRAQDLVSKTTDDGADYFANKVLPILAGRCFECHGAGKKIQGELVLTNRDALLAGGESGPVIDLENHLNSLLLSAVHYESLEMPPDGKLPKADIEILEQWVRMGVPWKGKGIQPINTDRNAPPQVDEETRRWWSYQPIGRPKLPVVQDREWVRNEIDPFILSRIEAAGLSPAPAASKQTLIRRAYYDLIGLPPSIEQVEAFVDDDSSDAYEQLVDSLLANPHYGEKWARHWLDIVRYAETNSYERDGIKPFVWKYRDYVIRSMNDDKPYDQFVVEQIAGDELPVEFGGVTADSVIATGYYRLGMWDDEPADREQAWFDEMDDVLSTTAQTFIGMTVGCARCHDHKIDPIPQTDYYRMLAFFRNVQRYGVRDHDSVTKASVTDIGSPAERRVQAGLLAKHREQVTQNQRQLEEIESVFKQDFSEVELEEYAYEQNRLRLARERLGTIITKAQYETYELLTAERDRLRVNPPSSIRKALCVKETGSVASETYVVIRGNAAARGKQVSPGFPTVLSPLEPEIEVPGHMNSTGRRLALAKWLVSSENPLTARVIVNRIWQHHFGRGIVRTPNDFGFQGTAPTHPQLLDWLADLVVSEGWRLKPIHKIIMLSNSYRMDSRTDATTIKADSANDLFTRFNLRRLTAEEIRDSILVINGKLNSKMFGGSVFPLLPREVLEGQSQPGKNWKTSSLDEQNRRSIYLHSKRSLSIPLMQNFDAADTDASCPVRFNTTQPVQALTMFNSDAMNREAADFAKLLQELAPDKIESQVTIALSRVFQREPIAEEVENGVSLLRQLTDENHVSRAKSLEYFCLVCLNMSEFIFVD